MPPWERATTDRPRRRVRNASTLPTRDRCVYCGGRIVREWGHEDVAALACLTCETTRADERRQRAAARRTTRPPLCDECRTWPADRYRQVQRRRTPEDNPYVCASCHRLAPPRDEHEQIDRSLQAMRVWRATMDRP
jgi:hypothetical protein